LPTTASAQKRSTLSPSPVFGGAVRSRSRPHPASMVLRRRSERRNQPRSLRGATPRVPGEEDRP
jgi:hypothetical protein